MVSYGSNTLGLPNAIKPSLSGTNLIRTWMWSDGINKSCSLAPRHTAHEAKSLLMTWIVPSKSSTEGYRQSARLHQSVVSRSWKALVSEWIWSNSLAQKTIVQDAQAGRALRLSKVTSTATLASFWLMRDGAARVPSWIQAEHRLARQGATRGSLAVTWLTTGVLPKSGGYASKVAFPVTALVVLAGASFYAKEVVSERKNIASLLVRRSSVETPARFALKCI